MTKQTYPSPLGGDTTAIAENIQYTHNKTEHKTFKRQKIILTGKKVVELNSWDSYLPTFCYLKRHLSISWCVKQVH